MKLTPLDIRHKEFRRAMRGYSDEEVDVFLDEVADEFERLFQENTELRDRVEQLLEQVRQYESLKETLQKTLVSAQQQSDEMRANARKEAELIIKDSEIKGRDLLGESYAEKQRVQQSLIVLKQVEEDFKFKFRSLLEAHINILAEDAASEERRVFRGFVSNVESESRQQAVKASPAVLPEHRSTGDSVDDQAAPRAKPELETEANGESPTPAGAEKSKVEVEGVASASSLGSEVRGAREPGGLSSASVVLDSVEERAPLTPVYEAVEASDGAATESGEHRESAVRRFLLGRKDGRSDKSDVSDGPEDRDFQW
ncbi:MAG: DivIVA domain-containing protein [Thermoleophilia bacterium]